MSAAVQQPVESPACPHCLKLIAFIRRDDKVGIRHGSIAELQHVGLDVIIPTNAQIRRLIPYLGRWCEAGLPDGSVEADE